MQAWTFDRGARGRFVTGGVANPCGIEGHSSSQKTAQENSILFELQVRYEYN